VLELLVDAASRHGVVTLDDVRAAGRSRSAWYRAHRCGLLVPLHAGVSRLATVRPSPEQAVDAAVRATDGIASHVSAARLWGVALRGADPVDVTVTRRGRSHRLAGVRVHRPTDVADLAPVVRAGIPTTTPLRTALDVGAVAPAEIVAAVVEHLVVHRFLGLCTLRAGVERHARRGRNGLGALRLVLDEWALGEKPPDGVLELAMARLLRDHRLPPAVFHHVITCDGRRFELDVGLLDHRVGIAVDGWRHHGSRRAFATDRARDAALAGVRWIVLRFTWRQVQFEPGWVAARIRAAIAARH
jgi:very-short-patch-repair endonuclease